MQLHYGKENMRFCYHYVLHAADAIQNWGPMWLNNCFHFEGENKKILEMKASLTKVATQLAKKYLFKAALHTFQDKFDISNHVKEFCNNLFSNNVKFYKKVGNVTLIGSGDKCDLVETDICRIDFDSEIDFCKSFLKLVVNGKKSTLAKFKKLFMHRTIIYQNQSQLYIKI